MSLEVRARAQLGDFTLDADIATDARRVCLFGRSGAGKSTLANVVAGLVRPDDGRVAIDGEALFDSAAGVAVPAWRRRIGYVFQEPRLFPHLNVRANLLYARRSGGAAAQDPSLPAVCALLGLEALVDRTPGDLSGGEARRVAIGRALLSAPRLIILDEPLTGLDGARRGELLAYIDALGRGGGPPMLYVSHSIEETARLADVVVLMRDGHTIACAPPAEAFDHPEAEAAAGLTAPISILEGRVLDHEAGATRLTLGPSTFLTPKLDLEPGEPARVVVDARDVTIALSDPTDSSVQNRLAARITAVEPHAGGLLLRLDAQGVRLKSLVTRTAADRLSLAPGGAVFALIKAVASPGTAEPVDAGGGGAQEDAVSEPPPRIVIVGAGHAGGTAAALLRQYGHTGEIVLIGEELIAPYQRPPLSKAYLKGEVDAETLKLKPDEFYADQDITLRLGTRVEAIDRAGRRVALKGGGEVPYDQLIIATGSSNRKLTLPSALPHQLHELRSVADAEQLKAVLEHGKRLAIIGGGYIGLEAAASARALGAEAVILELAPRVLARVACPELSSFFEAYHRARGVQILTEVQVADLVHGEGGHVSGVRLADDAVIACDLALVGVGAMACSQLAADAGLDCGNGVVVDALARTSDPLIHAIGDVTWRPMPLYGDRMHRLESVPNALEQAKQAVCDILGRPQPAPETPWFWSDQYDLKLQIAGVPFDSDDLVIRGSVEAAKFAIFHLKGDRILAVEAVNAPSEFMAGRLMIGQQKAVDRARLIDPEVSMKQVALG